MWYNLFIMNKVLYHTKFLDLKSIKTEKGSDWVYAHRPNASDVVVILPVTDDEILFLVENRPPILAENRGKYTIGLAAGLVGDERFGESVEEAINAELLEETGLIADKIEIKAKNVASSAGCTSETFIIAIAYIKDKTIIQQPVSDNGVIIDRVWVKKSEIHSWLQKMQEDGNVLTSQSLASLFYLN